MHVWNVIATEGAAYQMLDGNAYGMNTDGFYDPELVAHFAAQRLHRGHELSKTVKLVGLSGRYTFEVGGGKYYAMARQLVPELRAAYDAALTRFDVLVMPTVPYTAQQIPRPMPDWPITCMSRCRWWATPLPSTSPGTRRARSLPVWSVACRQV